jgi:hypothetical protein
LNNNVAKLTDFGIAVKFDDAKQINQTFNWSAYWTAPEVISTEPINELCDIWSVGITAIELFVGEPPFYELAPVTAAFRITQCAQPPLPEKASPEFRDFLDSCLKKDVQFRKPASQLLHHIFIQKYCSGRPGRALFLDDDRRPLTDTGAPPARDTPPRPLDPPALADPADGDSHAFRPGRPPNFDALDRLLEDPEEAARQMAIERENNIFEAVRRSMERLPAIAGDVLEVSSVCRHLLQLFETEPFLKARLPSSRAVVPVVRILQSRHDALLVSSFPFVLSAGRDNPRLHRSLCILGILPYLFEYSSDARYSAPTQELALTFLHQMCTARPGKSGVPRALPMFIAAGGLPRLARILSIFPHDERPSLTPLVLGIVYRTLISRCRTPKSCLARILARAEFLDLLAARYRDVRGDEPSLFEICALFEIFSSGDAAVKRPMAQPSFVAVLFTRARAGGGLSGRALACVVNCLSNLSMDDRLLEALWRGPLSDLLAAYLDVSRPHFAIAPPVEKCFATLFHMARLVPADACARIARFVPAIVAIAGRESPLRDFAVTLLLECVANHGARSAAVRAALRRSGAVDRVFALVREHPRKEHVLAAIEQWCAAEPAVVQREVLARFAEFADVVAGVFGGDPEEGQAAVGRCVLGICDRCRGVAAEIAHSAVVGAIIEAVLGRDLSEMPGLRVAFVSIVLSCYEATRRPKRMIAEFQLLAVAEKLADDQSAPVQALARQLRQAVASNYIL